MRIALTDVLSGGCAGATTVHLVHPWNYQTTLCGQYEDGRVAHYGTGLAVDCMTCLVRASDQPQRLPKEFLFAENEDNGVDDR